MTFYKLLTLMVSLFAFSTNASSQTESFKFPDSTFYSKAKIYFEDNKRFEVKNLIINEDRLTFTRNNKRDNYQLSDVYIVKVQKGTRAGQYAIYGALTFGLSAALALAQVASDPFVESEVNEGAFIGGFTLGGALLGALVGSTQTTWKTLYVNNETTSLIFTNPQLFVKANQKYLGLNLSLSF